MYVNLMQYVVSWILAQEMYRYLYNVHIFCEKYIFFVAHFKIAFSKIVSKDLRMRSSKRNTLFYCNFAIKTPCQIHYLVKCPIQLRFCVKLCLWTKEVSGQGPKVTLNWGSWACFLKPKPSLKIGSVNKAFLFWYWQRLKEIF